MGKVYLLGAGCGSYDLITLKGATILKQADCVLYDRLIDPQLLQMLPQHCETIHVGKENHHHTMPQQEIEQLLIAKAKQYACVVRLKGGDPYVFGRGGEEGIALMKANIPFEVIPGISSSIASMTYAGFPITHRGIARGFRVYSAHTKEDELSELDYASMAKSEDTLVFMMGLKHKQEIFLQLLTHGKDAMTPVAMISNAARSNQQVIYTTLQQAYQQDVSIESPCTIVVGNVVSLHESLDFFSQKKLRNKRIFYPVLQKDLQSNPLREEGAMVDEVLIGMIKDVPNQLKTIDLSKITYIIFTSKHGIRSFFHQLWELGKDARNVSHIKFACIGKKCTQALLSYGIQSDYTAIHENSLQMGQELKAVLNKEDHILIAKADNDHHTLEQQLRDYDVTTIGLYRSIPIPFQTTYETYDAMIFTSAFHVNTCAHVLHHAKMFFSIGPHTSEALRLHGVIHIIESKKADKQVLFETVKKELTHV